MKQLIKSAIVYNAVLPSENNLREHLASSQFVEPMSLQSSSIGFVLREGAESLVEDFPGGLSFTVRIDQKIIPGSVVNAELAKHLKTLLQTTGRKPGKKERAEIKNDVRDALLERALVRTILLTCFHHTATNLLIIPTTNKKLAGSVVSELVNAVGSVKTTTIHVSNVKQGLTTRLAGWLGGAEQAFSGLYPRGEVGLEEGPRRVTIRMDELTSASSGLQEALQSGFQVKSLGLQFEGGTDIKLTDDFHLRAIAFSHPPVEEDDMFAAEAALETGEIADVVTFLCEMFGYKVEEVAP